MNPIVAQEQQQKRQAEDKRLEQQRVRRYLTNDLALDRVMAHIAIGKPLKDIAEELNIEYIALHRVITSDFAKQYKDAKVARAEYLSDRNLTMADMVQDGDMDPKAASTAANIRQWNMERSAPDNWQQKSTMNVNLKGTVGLHLEAIRQLSSYDPSEVEDGEFEEIEPTDDLDSHPLL